MEDLANMARLSTVETEGELVEIALKMFWADLSLMGRGQPAFEEGDNQVGMCEFLGRQLRVSCRVGHSMAQGPALE